MFQLLHLRLTAPRKDPGAFAAWREDQLEWARNRLKLPEVSFYDHMNAVYSGNHPRRQPVTPEMLDKLDLDKAHAVFAQRFADLSGFTFVIVGNVDLATLQPLVERYLGSLPGKGARTTWKDIGVRYATGKVQREVKRGTEPKSYVSMTFGAPTTWSRDAARDAQVLGMILDIRLREVLREDMGGVYGAWASIDVTRQPTVRREAYIQFGCDPANVEKLRDATFTVIHDIQKNGIGDVYLEKVREQLKRGRETDAKENWWWRNQLREAYWYGDKLADATNLDAVLARVTSDRIKAAAKVFFDEKNVVIGVMRPER